jgi:DNA-binding transcriptional MerR regulator
MSSDLKIGELASAAGVSTDTVRYYERLKLIPRPGRTHAGYRVYSDQDVDLLQFIKRAQSLGLSLDEVKSLLPGRGSDLSECRRVRDLLSAKLAELDARISEMRAFRKTLGSYLNECEEALAGRRGDSCPALFEITRPASDKQKASSANRGAKSLPRGVNR